MNLPTDWKPAQEKPDPGTIVLLYIKGTLLSFFKFCEGDGPSDSEPNRKEDDYFSDVNSKSFIPAATPGLLWLPATKIIEP